MRNPVNALLKKRFIFNGLLSLSFLLAAGVVIAQQAKDQAVPASVKAAFAKQFPGSSKVKWEKEKENYEANFVQQGHEMAAVFRADGTLEETEWEIKVADLPPAIASYVKAHYKGAVIKEAAKITKPNGEQLYEAALKNKDLIFSAKGEFLREEPKN